MNAVDNAPPGAGRGLGGGALLVLLTFLFRLPAILNFGALDSDIAVVGLQAWHLGEGPRPLLLWGTTYQGVTAPVMARLVELLLPIRASLAVSSVLGHALLVLCLYGALRRRLPSRWAALAAACVAVCPEPLNFLTYSAFRIWAFTLLFAGLYLAERSARAGSSTRRLLLAVMAGGAVGLGYYTDLFVLQLLPGVVLYLLGWAWEPRASRWLALGGALVGFGLGSIPRWLARMEAPQLSELSWSNLKHNWPLFWSKCLPYVTGTKLFATTTGFDRPEQVLEGPWLVLASVGMGLFAGMAVAGALLSLAPGMEWSARRLAWCGAAWMGASLVAFLFTRRPQDLMSARYLVPVLLGFPLLVSPVLARLPRGRGTVWVSALLLPVIAHFGVAGWRGHGGWIHHGLPRITPEGNGDDARVLLSALQQRGVEAAVADYWVAYRLTYLWKEQVTVAPGTGDNRYAPYSRRFESAARRALLFSAIVPGSRYLVPGPWEATLRREGWPHERLTAGPYEVLLLK
ncbi:hypothetical protein CYFUS_007119 [Cystobacter fuscus]|uniref:Glycosyltransferase RgtA/B/C/D-like domain-containing protein n=1 Tax=Cystobacter fuscus TaxID=43 RepID=A0A250JE36_9BACT|nr:hypothetical protein [Cystobacter fuscus]ATB41651.1 hypothetical protein CYFUS_007119 [Cystobacter fuscus]